MSQRPPVDRQRIEEFLRRLGRQFRRPGRIYLVGGTTMVFEGFRGHTLDIDIAAEITAEDHTAFIRAIRDLPIFCLAWAQPASSKILRNSSANSMC